MKQLFSRNQNRIAYSPLNALVDNIRQHLNQSNSLEPSLGKLAVSTEGLNDSQYHTLTSAANSLSTSLESIVEDMNLRNDVSEYQLEAAVLAAILSTDYRGHLARKPKQVSAATENEIVVSSIYANDVVSDRAFALEAYDERENRNAALYSIAYNMQAARQDEFGEAFFPTLVISNDQSGFGVTVNLMTVYDGVERQITGSFEDFKRKNIIRAIADPTVLKKNQTKVIPVYRAQAADKFVDPALVATVNYINEGETIPTGPLKIGQEMDLIGISQTEALLQAGVMNETDSLDPTITLSNVYVKFGNDVLKFNTLSLPLSNFTYSTQNNYRVMTLNFETTSVLVNKGTLQADGSALVDLADVVNNDLIFRLKLNLSGNVNIQTGQCQVYANNVSVYTVQDNTGADLDPAALPAAPLVTALNGGSVLGYDLQAYRANMNRRQRGQLIDNTKFTQLYSVPLLSPITAIHPINTDGETDASDIQSLITTTRIRTSNDSVTALLSASEILSEYVDSRDVTGVGPDVLGTGRFFVRPTFFQESIDMNQIVDSLNSQNRPADIQAALVNKIRDYVYRMYRNSEYKAAADALRGGISETPVAIIGTDPVIARYLNVTGDLRTLGSEFDVRIVQTLDNRVAGKIFISFGVFDESRNVAPNPMNFGNMVWAPELALTANITRGGQISKETVVQPRYLFVVHLPIMTVLQISGISDTINKIPVNFHNV